MDRQLIQGTGMLGLNAELLRWLTKGPDGEGPPSGSAAAILT
jgi:hypothetical protein